MAGFSIQDAAFTGFRVVREHPRALGVWAVYALLLSIVFGVILVGLMGSDLADLTAASAQGGTPRDTARAMAALARLTPGYVLFMAVGMVFNAILGAAMIRSVLRPLEDRFGYLRLGADELRQLGLAALTFVVFLGASLGMAIALAVVAGLMGLAGAAAAGVTGVFGALAIVAALAFLGVRLSLAPALTFDTGRINLFGSWSLTHGRFWPLFGAYLLTFAMIVIVYVLGLLVIIALAAAMNGGDPVTTLMKSDTRSLGAYFTPARIAETVLSAGISALIWPVALTPPTAIYRRLAPAAAADAFA
jgi:hypothetical protein